jgi:hypothetical protein
LKNVEGSRDEKREERSINEEGRKETKRFEQIESNVRVTEGGGRSKEIEKREDSREAKRGKTDEGRGTKRTERGVERMRRSNQNALRGMIESKS